MTRWTPVIGRMGATSAGRAGVRRPLALLRVEPGRDPAGEPDREARVADHLTDLMGSGLDL